MRKPFLDPPAYSPRKLFMPRLFPHFVALLFALLTSLGPLLARADLVSPPPPCKGKAAGDTCETLHLDRGVCTALNCKPGDGDTCLQCVVPPDPPVNDPPAPSASSPSTPPIPVPPPAPPSPPSSRVSLALLLAVALGGLAGLFWWVRRSKRP